MKKVAIGSMLVGIAMWATVVSAVPIPISNHSFEDPVQDSGGWSDINLDWGDDAGTDGAHFTEFIPGFVADGLQHTGIQADSSIFQTLATTFEDAAVYTLTVAIGNRNLNFTPDDPELESEIRLINGTDGTVLATAAFDAFPFGESTFEDRSLVYVAEAAEAGQPIMIELADVGEGRAHFDNVRLDVDTGGFLADFNNDNVVDLLDYPSIRDNFLLAPSSHSQGDANRDGTTDIKDFRIWKNEAFPGAPVPEPAAFGLLLAAMSAALLPRRRVNRAD